MPAYKGIWAQVLDNNPHFSVYGQTLEDLGQPLLALS